MAFDVSALANYTKENEALLVTSSVLGSKTEDMINQKTIKNALLWTGAFVAYRLYKLYEVMG